MYRLLKPVHFETDNNSSLSPNHQLQCLKIDADVCPAWYDDDAYEGDDVNHRLALAEIHLMGLGMEYK